jgi:hypothetical protein
VLACATAIPAGRPGLNQGGATTRRASGGWCFPRMSPEHDAPFGRVVAPPAFADHSGRAPNGDPPGATTRRASGAWCFR